MEQGGGEQGGGGSFLVGSFGLIFTCMYPQLVREF